MCLMSFSWQQHKQYPFVLVANRDEFFNRPTQSMHFWQDNPDILAGRDLQAGGTWLGLHRRGRFAALTNVRNPNEQREATTTKSRGLLVTEFLNSHYRPIDFLQQLHDSSTEYNGFNLLVSDGETLAFYSTVDQSVQSLAPGIYGLSNASLDTPWPKVIKARDHLSHWIKEQHKPLIELLHNAEIVSDDQLPDTGIPLEWERGLSAQFISLPGYGTRCSTAITLNTDGQLSVEEMNFNEQGDAEKQSFQLDSFWD
jgi:uncharacterized protein with NRDE domain